MWTWMYKRGLMVIECGVTGCALIITTSVRFDIFTVVSGEWGVRCGVWGAGRVECGVRSSEFGGERVRWGRRRRGAGVRVRERVEVKGATGATGTTGTTGTIGAISPCRWRWWGCSVRPAATRHPTPCLSRSPNCNPNCIRLHRSRLDYSNSNSISNNLTSHTTPLLTGLTFDLPPASYLSHLSHLWVQQCCVWGYVRSRLDP